MTLHSPPARVPPASSGERTRHGAGRPAAFLDGSAGTAGAMPLVEALSRTTPLIEFAMDGVILAANESYLRIIGGDATHLVGRHHNVLIHPDDLDLVAQAKFWEALRSGRTVQIEQRCVARDGEEVWLQASYNPVFDADGRAERVVKIANDVTLERRHAENHRNTLEAISRSTAMVEFALDGTILYANPAYLQIMGYSDLEIRGRSHRLFLSKGDHLRPEYDEFWNRLRAGEFIQSEFNRLGKGGRSVWLQASYNPIFGPDGRPTRILKVATDVTEAVELRSEMAKLAFVDSLTGLGNRRKFDHGMAAALERCKRDGDELALLLIDIDHFKRFNDSYGHHEGDECLRRVAGAIADAFRRATDLVMRFGGEEFAVLLPGTSAAGVATLAEKCRAAVEALAIENRATEAGVVSVSIGYALIDADAGLDEASATELLTRADAALYEAKALGRNQTSGGAPPPLGLIAHRSFVAA